MKNFDQPGWTVTVEAPVGGVSSGDPLQVNKLFGICCNDAAAGEDVELRLVGAFTLPTTATETWAVGEIAYFDPATGLLTTTAGALDIVAVALDAVTGPAEGSFLLLGPAFATQ